MDDWDTLDATFGRGSGGDDESQADEYEDADSEHWGSGR